MSPGNYEFLVALPGHTSSIRVLRFSPHGDYLASGGDDGLVLVFSTDSWEVVAKVVNVSPVTALLWNSAFPKTIICGFLSGAVVTICLDSGDRVRSDPLSPSASHLTSPLGQSWQKNMDGYV